MQRVPDEELRRRFRSARRDPQLTVLEGFHAYKHALRFGAEIETAVATDPGELEELVADLAAVVVGRISLAGSGMGWGRSMRRRWRGSCRGRRGPESSRSLVAKLRISTRLSPIP